VRSIQFFKKILFSISPHPCALSPRTPLDSSEYSSCDQVKPSTLDNFDTLREHVAFLPNFSSKLPFPVAWSRRGGRSFRDASRSPRDASGVGIEINRCGRCNVASSRCQTSTCPIAISDYRWPILRVLRIFRSATFFADSERFSPFACFRECWLGSPYIRFGPVVEIHPPLSRHVRLGFAYRRVGVASDNPIIYLRPTSCLECGLGYHSAGRRHGFLWPSFFGRAGASPYALRAA